MPLTYTYDNATLTSLLGDTVYAGLSTADPTKDGSGIAEPVGGDYARVAILAADWGAPANGVCSNTGTVTFPTPAGNWGTPLYATLHTAVSGGSVIGYGGLDNPQAVGVGSTAPTFAAGTFRVQVD